LGIGSETFDDIFSLLNRKPALVIIHGIWQNNNSEATQRRDCSERRFEAIACASGITKREARVKTGSYQNIIANNRCGP